MSRTLFKKTDIRGEYPKDINEDKVRGITRAFGKMADHGTVVLGGDTRASTPGLLEAARTGLREAGCRVMDIGCVTTPWLAFARDHLKASGGLMVTASHNPSSQNGLKLILAAGAFSQENMSDLRALWDEQSGAAAAAGSLEKLDLSDAYKEFLCKPFGETGRLRVVLDAGGGAAGLMGPVAFRSLGFEVEELFCEPGMEKSGRSPDPGLPGALDSLAQRVQERRADLGFGFDGDGDRMVAMTETGRTLTADEVLGLMARKVLKDQPGAAVVYDIKMSQAIEDVVLGSGGRPVRCPTGQYDVRLALKREKAVLAGEYSGHFLMADLSPYDDGILAALYLSFLVQEAGKPLSKLVEGLPRYATTREIRVLIPSDPGKLLKDLRSHLPPDVQIDTMDGIRAVFKTGWALARASGTENALTFRFETKKSEDLEAMIHTFLEGVPEIRSSVIDGAGMKPDAKPQD